MNVPIGRDVSCLTLPQGFQTVFTDSSSVGEGHDGRVSEEIGVKERAGRLKVVTVDETKRTRRRRALVPARRHQALRGNISRSLEGRFSRFGRRFTASRTAPSSLELPARRFSPSRDFRSRYSFLPSLLLPSSISDAKINKTTHTSIVCGLNLARYGPTELPCTRSLCPSRPIFPAASRFTPCVR